MSIFAQFPPNTPSLLTALQVAEQVAQLLFGTMNQDLFIDDGHDETSAAKWFADKVAAPYTHVSSHCCICEDWLETTGGDLRMQLALSTHKSSVTYVPVAMSRFGSWWESVTCGVSQRVEEVPKWISNAWQEYPLACALY